MEVRFTGPVRRVWISFITFDLRIHFRNKVGLWNPQRWRSTFSAARTVLFFLCFLSFLGAETNNSILCCLPVLYADLPRYLRWTASLFHACGWLLPSLPAGKWRPLQQTDALHLFKPPSEDWLWENGCGGGRSGAASSSGTDRGRAETAKLK